MSLKAHSGLVVIAIVLVTVGETVSVSDAQEMKPCPMRRYKTDKPIGCARASGDDTDIDTTTLIEHSVSKITDDTK